MHDVMMEAILQVAERADRDGRGELTERGHRQMAAILDSAAAPGDRFSEDDWTHSTGPKGGSIWTHNTTGLKKWQRDNPGRKEGANDRVEPKQERQSGSAPPPKPTRPPPAPPTTSPDHFTLKHVDANHPVAKKIAADHRSVGIVSKLAAGASAGGSYTLEIDEVQDDIKKNAEKVRDRSITGEQRAKVMAEYHDLDAKQSRLKAGREGRAREGRKEFVRELGERKRPLNVDVVHEDQDEDSKRDVAGAKAFVAQVCEWGDDAAEVRCRASRDGRAKYYDKAAGGPTLETHGNGTPDYREQVAVHELGHMIEYRKPGVQKVAMDFLAYRCGNEPYSPIPGLPGEEGRADQFGRHFKERREALYVGKRYAFAATEVISMGVEELHRDAAAFCHNDPEYAAFVVGVLLGEFNQEGS